MSAPPLCPDPELNAILAAAQASSDVGLQRLGEALAAYGDDPRLHFLKGSLLAAEQRYPEALSALSTAVTLAPDYGVARFQLGLLQLTSAQSEAARLTLDPLATGDSGFLGRFATGLTLLMDDRLQDAVDALDLGLEANTTLPPMNNDMRLLRDEIKRNLAAQNGQAPETSSSTELMLRYFSRRDSLH